MTTNPEVSWTTVVARGSSKRVITPSFAAKKSNADIRLSSKVIFEHDGLKEQLLARKATAIVQQALTPGSVLFSFPSSLFKHRGDAYMAIQEQCGEVIGVCPVSLYGARATDELLVEAKFAQAESSVKALTMGITVGDLVFKAVSSKDDMVNTSMVHVQMNIPYIPDKATFVSDLKRSLRYYGEVYQVKQFTCNGFFEGQVSVMIDVSGGYVNGEGKTVPCQPLARNLYLGEWDIYVSASFKGAAPICHFCRQAGHLRSNCPDLAKRVCFSCRDRGHTARFCKAKSVSEGVLLDEYVKDTTKKVAGSDIEVLEDVRNEDIPDSEDGNDDSDAEMTQAERLSKSAEYFNSRENGTAKSKHASVSVAIDMAIDEAEEVSGDSGDMTGGVTSGGSRGSSSGGSSGVPGGGSVKGSIGSDLRNLKVHIPVKHSKVTMVRKANSGKVPHKSINVPASKAT
jgi:hypothetical protein